MAATFGRQYGKWAAWNGSTDDVRRLLDKIDAAVAPSARKGSAGLRIEAGYAGGVTLTATGATVDEVMDDFVKHVDQSKCRSLSISGGWASPGSTLLTVRLRWNGPLLSVTMDDVQAGEQAYATLRDEITRRSPWWGRHYGVAASLQAVAGILLYYVLVWRTNALLGDAASDVGVAVLVAVGALILANVVAMALRFTWLKGFELLAPGEKPRSVRWAGWILGVVIVPVLISLAVG